MYQKLTVLFPVVFFYCFIHAQVGIRSQIDAGGNNLDDFTALAVTKDGGFIAGGFSNSDISGEKTQNCRGGNDYWVVKYDKKGKKQWDKTIGGNDDDKLYAILQTDDRGYLLGGLSSSNASGEKTKNRIGDADYWIVKLDSAGNIQWDKTIGGSQLDFLTCLSKTNDGGYLLAGMSLSDSGFDKTENCRGGYDYWIVEINKKGKVLWDKTIGGSQYEYFTSVLQTRDSGFILHGRSYSDISGEKSQNSRGAGDYWVVKLNKQHQMEWDKTIGGSLNEFPANVVQMPDDGYMLYGSSESGISGEKTDSSRGNADYWLVKINKKGVVKWDKTIGGSDLDYAGSMQLTRDSGLIICGYSYSGISGEKSEAERGYYFDYWIVKLNAKLQISWDKTIGGFADDQAAVIKETGAGKYIIGGTSSSDISFDKTQNSRGWDDYWFVNIQDSGIATLNVATDTDASPATLSQKEGNFLKAFPTVTKSIINVEVKGTTVVSLFDVQGRLILRKTVKDKTQFILSQLMPGLYYFKDEHTNAVAKFIIER